MAQAANRVVAFALTCMAAQAVTTAAAPTDTLRALQAGAHRISVEVADTPQRRALGLMYRDRLAPDHGMLFRFDRRARHCMFMRNTRIPLSAAFVDADGTIVAIAHMQPFSERLHCAPQPVAHVLEMEQGWFAARGIGPGDRIQGLDGSLPDPVL